MFVWVFFFLSSQHFKYIMPLHLACKVSAEKSADKLLEFPLDVILCFYFGTFKTVFLSFNFCLFNYNMSWCQSLWVYLALNTVFPGPAYIFFMLGKISTIISSNISFAPYCLSFLHEIPMSQKLAHLTLSQRSFKLF